MAAAVLSCAWSMCSTASVPACEQAYAQVQKSGGLCHQLAVLSYLRTMAHCRRLQFLSKTYFLKTSCNLCTGLAGSCLASSGTPLLKCTLYFPLLPNAPCRTPTSPAPVVTLRFSNSEMSLSFLNRPRPIAVCASFHLTGATELSTSRQMHRAIASEV